MRPSISALALPNAASTSWVTIFWSFLISFGRFPSHETGQRRMFPNLSISARWSGVTTVLESICKNRRASDFMRRRLKKWEIFDFSDNSRPLNLISVMKFKALPDRNIVERYTIPVLWANVWELRSANRIRKLAIEVLWLKAAVVGLPSVDLVKGLKKTSSPISSTSDRRLITSTCRSNE